MCDTLKKKSKRSFSEAWLSDEKCKSWIRKVSFDDSLFHCVICNKNYSYSSSHVLRHANSESHKNNIEKSQSLLNNDDESWNKKIPQKHRFQQQWLEIDLFKPWLREVSNDEYSFSCIVCNTSGSAGLTKIYRHSESKIHKINCEKNDIPINQYESEDVSMENESTLSFSDRTKSFEVRYAALIADNNISYQSAEKILSFFQEAGKDYNVLKNMKMSRTKCTNIIKNVLCPVEMDRVVNTIIPKY